MRRELTGLRTRVEGIETHAVEAANEDVDDLLDVLEYANLDRIWLERTETDGRTSHRTSTSSPFGLHVVRSTDSGAAYEDTIDHLSESER